MNRKEIVKSSATLKRLRFPWQNIVMKKITVRSISLQNFCGIASGVRAFNGEDEFICAGFGSGKSSFYHGYQWTMGLNVPFEPNIEGKKVKGIETKVSVTFNDGVADTEFARTAKQCWKTEAIGADGRAVERFDKYAYRYFVDGIELKSKQYAEKVLSYFGAESETEINILTDTQYFNGTAEPKWNAEKRRAFLFKAFGVAEKTEELAKGYPLIYNELYVSKVSQETLRKDIKHKRDEIKRQQAMNQGAMQEILREMSELNIDYDAVQVEAEKNRQHIAELTVEKARLESNDARNAVKGEIDVICQKQRAEMADFRAAMSSYLGKKARLTANREQMRATVSSLKYALNDLDNQLEELNIEESEVAQTVLNDGDTKCPTCGRKLTEATLNKKKEALNDAKTRKIAQIAERRREVSLRRTETVARLDSSTAELKALESEIKALESQEPAEPVFAESNAKLDELRAQLADATKPTESVDAELQAAYQESICLAAKLAGKTRLTALRERLTATQQEIMKLADADTELIRQSQELDDFAVKEIEVATETINAAFGGAVKFNFFEELGGTTDKGFKKTCVATMNGIAYPNLSGGQQMLCDYLVNVALRKIMERNVPLWIDEICRVTNDTEKIKQIFAEQPTDAQRICLVTTDGVKLPVTSVKDVYAR